MNNYNHTPISTEPPWLTAKTDQLLALLESKMDLAALSQTYGIVLLLLDEPESGCTPAQRARWERACSKCDAFTQPGFPYYTGYLVREHKGLMISVTFGVCLSHTSDFNVAELTEIT